MISANILPIVIDASQMAVNSKFVLGWHGTHCRMQIIGLGFVVKYTYARGQVTKSEDMPRPDARGRGRGQHVEVEAEDKISASRTVWPRGLNITGGYTFYELPDMYYAVTGVCAHVTAVYYMYECRLSLSLKISVCSLKISVCS